jgi:hypothetical protein
MLKKMDASIASCSSDDAQERHSKGVECDAISSSELHRLIRRTMELLNGLADHVTEEIIVDRRKIDRLARAISVVDPTETSVMHYRGRLAGSRL